MFWFKSLLVILFFSSFQTTYAVLENDATRDLNHNTVEREAQNRLHAVSDGLSVIWENTVLTSADSVINLVFNSSKTKLKLLCGHKNKTALLYISSRNFIDLKFHTHKIAYQFHSFP